MSLLKALRSPVPAIASMFIGVDKVKAKYLRKAVSYIKRDPGYIDWSFPSNCQCALLAKIVAHSRWKMLSFTDYPKNSFTKHVNSKDNVRKSVQVLFDAGFSREEISRLEMLTDLYDYTHMNDDLFWSRLKSNASNYKNVIKYWEEYVTNLENGVNDFPKSQVVEDIAENVEA